MNYSGQGADADSGNNYWNPIVPNGTTVAATNSDGVTISTVTLTETQSAAYNDGGPGTQGSPSGLQTYFADANSSATEINTLNHVPSGTYALYLYGINGGSGDSDRGTIFTVSSDLTSAMTNGTINTTAAYNTFIQGNDYVVFTDIVVGTGGTITFTYTHNPAATGITNNTQGNFNGLQLVASTLVSGGGFGGAIQSRVITSPSPLSIQSVSAAQGLTLQWPDNSGAKSKTSGAELSQQNLYYTPDLTPPVVWTLITNIPVLSNGQWTLTLPPSTNSEGFYQLQ